MLYQGRCVRCTGSSSKGAMSPGIYTHGRDTLGLWSGALFQAKPVP